MGSVHGNKEIELVFLGPEFSDIDVDIADWRALERLALELAAIHIKQAGNAMAVKAAQQGKMRQVRDRGLQSIAAIL